MSSCRRVGGQRGVSRRTSLALALALALALGVVSVAQSPDTAPLPSPMDPPQEPGRVMLVPDGNGQVHVIVQAFEVTGTRIYHGFYDVATRNVRDFTVMSTTKHNLGPDAIALADGSLQVAWWESDAEGDVFDAMDRTRVVTRNWNDGALGPIEVVNATYGGSGSLEMAEDGSGVLAVHTLGDARAHVFTRPPRGSWTETIAPSLSAVSNNRFAQSIWGLDDGFAVGWVERDSIQFREVRRGVVQVLTDGEWGARKALSNETTGIAIAGSTANPWVFFVSALIDDENRARLDDPREVYGVPLSQAGRTIPLNVSRTPTASERFELLATVHDGKPAVAFFRGQDRDGTFAVSYGPPFQAGTIMGRWEFSAETAFFIDTLSSIGGELAFTAQTADLTVDIGAGEAPPRSSLLWTFEPPPIVDGADPQVRISFPEHGGAYRSLREARGLVFDDVGFDPDTVEVALDGAPVTEGVEATLTGFRARLPSPAEGSHEVRVSVADFAGKRATSSATFVIDRTPPSARATADPVPAGDSWTAEPVTVTLTGQDEGSGVNLIRYSTNNITFKDYGEPVVLGGAGLQKLWFIAFDRAGNRGEVQRVEYRVDTTPPVIDLRLPAFAPGKATLAWTVTDPESGVAFVEIPGPAGAEPANIGASGTRSIDVRAPFTTVQLWATNGAGLRSEARRDVGFDGGPPTLDVGDLPAAAGRIRIEAEDAVSNVTVDAHVDGGSWVIVAGPPYSYDHDPSAHAQGEHTLSVRARDEAGNTVFSNQTFTGTGVAVVDDKGSPFLEPMLTVFALLAVGIAARRRG